MTAESPLVSVVIATLNREEVLVQLLKQLLDCDSTPPFEIIVVDQSSEHAPETNAFLAQAATRLTHLRVSYRSVTRARNDGIRKATGTIVIFVDDDVVLHPGFIGAHVTAYSDPRVVGATGPVSERGGTTVKRQDLPAEVVRSLDQQATMRFDVDFPFDAQWATGGNMSFRKAAIIAVGGFDEQFQGAAIGEEAEFSHRVKKIGVIRYVPEARVTHLAVPSGGSRSAATRAEYVGEIGFCTGYFWRRVDADWPRRWRMTWKALRRHVLNRRRMAEGEILQLTFHFVAGVARSRTAVARRPWTSPSNEAVPE